MRKKIGSSKKQSPVLKESKSPKELEDFIREADEVRNLTTQTGWGILERDINQYRTEISNKLAYLDPKSKEYYESKILFIASDKLLSLVNDYQENRDKAIELMTKLENPSLAITMDVDGE